MRRLLPYLTLASSLSTLVCCALPALLVSLGLGASLVSILSAAPELIWISEHKGAVFGTAGALLALTWALRVRSNSAACPADPGLAAACRGAKAASGAAFYLSVLAYCVGGFFAFVAPLLM